MAALNIDVVSEGQPTQQCQAAHERKDMKVLFRSGREWPYVNVHAAERRSPTSNYPAVASDQGAFFAREEGPESVSDPLLAGV